MKVNLGRYPSGSGQRKISVQIDSYDDWSLDHSLALIIYPALLQLKQNKNGVPSSLTDKIGGEDYVEQDSFEFYQETHDECFKKVCDEWDEILDKMIWSFEQLAFDQYESQYHHGKMEMDWVETGETYFNPLTNKHEKTYQMVDKNPDDHWFDVDGLRLHEERIQEGLDLFAKYYRSLWT